MTRIRTHTSNSSNTERGISELAMIASSLLDRSVLVLIAIQNIKSVMTAFKKDINESIEVN